MLFKLTRARGNAIGTRPDMMWLGRARSGLQRYLNAPGEHVSSQTLKGGGAFGADPFLAFEEMFAGPVQTAFNPELEF